MLSQLIRKVRQVKADPVLRRWLAGRVMGRWSGEPPFNPHIPPYLENLLPLEPGQGSCNFTSFQATAPSSAVTLKLAGKSLLLQPGDEIGIFERPFDDIETFLSLHRFAWLSDDLDPGWVSAMWRSWCASHGEPSETWAWHPYTAGERAVNILAYGREKGLPEPFGETVDILTTHATSISRKLEYFGDHHTSNHLANNGRALFVLGLELNLPEATRIGTRILLAEAERMFSPSGMLREGSSHYHLLYLALYEMVAGLAAEQSHPEATALREIANRCRAVAGHLILPGGLPLIGDISPDITPTDLLGKLDLAPDTSPFCADGWLRYESGPWTGLWHASSEGWSHMPGHGHQDIGGFELHYDNIPLFIDPGRGAYGEDGDAAYYRSAQAHNGLTVNEADPFPANKPYYDSGFRRQISGPPPVLSATTDEVSLKHNGFARLGSIEEHKRVWRFDGHHMMLEDFVGGSARTRLMRTLITPLVPEQTVGGILLRGDAVTFRVHQDGGDVDIENIRRWTAYGISEPAFALRFKASSHLPFHGKITVEVT